jgi:hypothetical protein
MKYSTEQMISHISSIIDRQQENLEDLLSIKPKPASQLERAKARIVELRSFRYDLSLGKIRNKNLYESVVRDMEEIGW